MNHHQLFHRLISGLRSLGIDDGEAEAEARLLFRDGMGLNLADLLAQRVIRDHPGRENDPASVTGSQQTTVDEYLRRRAVHEPPQYIIGRAGFWDFQVHVAPGVLIPRPETEHLVEAVLRYLPAEAGTLLEIGTGSGAPLAAVLRERPAWKAVATEISAVALEIARKNFTDLGVIDRVDLRQDDLYDGTERFPLIFSNPPYIADGDRDRLAPELRAEPESALYSGTDGLDVIRRILDSVGNWLTPGGLLLFELGQGQAETVSQLAGDAGLFPRQVIADYSQIPRVLVLEDTR